MLESAAAGAVEAASAVASSCFSRISEAESLNNQCATTALSNPPRSRTASRTEARTADCLEVLDGIGGKERGGMHHV